MTVAGRAIAEGGAALLSTALMSHRVLSGGDISETVSIVLADGRRAVVKRTPQAAIEADMLRVLAHTGAPAPEVLGVSDTLLVLSYLPDGSGIASAWEDFGRVLSRLHGADVPPDTRYGWACDYAFGPVLIPAGRDEETPDWPRFWGRHRLAINLPHVPDEIAPRLETLIAQLPDRLPAHPRPCLLHGDAWTGNVLASGGRVTGLIDPACLYGDREAEFAILTLFARPPETFWEAYGSLDAGWKTRLPVYRLWPALVHLRLFGRGYLDTVRAALTECGV